MNPLFGAFRPVAWRRCLDAVADELCACKETPCRHSVRYPKGMVDTAIATLEAVRPDYFDRGAIKWLIDDALDRLYRFREIETDAPHPYRTAE